MKLSSLSTAGLLLAAAILAAAGCQEAPDSSAVESTDRPLATIPADQLTRRGGLTFISGLANGSRVASESRRPSLVFFTADWCTFCHQMEESAFRDERVKQRAGKFVCILVDADREKQACRRLGVSGYPTIQFFSAHGDPLNRLKGRQSCEQLLHGMDAALERFAKLNANDQLVR